MGLLRSIAVATGVMLASSACSATGATQEAAAPTPQATGTGAVAVQPQPVTPPWEQPAIQPPVFQQEQSSQQSPAPAERQPSPATPEQAPAPATSATPSSPAAPTPPTEADVEPVAGAPGAAPYVPKTEHDNTPWRFNMQQDGKSMSADEFDAWMKQRGVRVATGQPAVPLAQNCPTPEGDRGDDDGDRIINCLDQCPDSEAGQTIGPDGCPVPVSIDLQGVTFAYDAATLGDSAKSVLDEAAEILRRHPSLTVEVAGHTDSRGDAGYNQKLSERRARVVYDYLVAQGIDESRLIGPVGFGESRPLVPNETPDGKDDPKGRAENRRTELNIQN